MINLTDWDIVLINTSGGKDSQAMLDYVVNAAREAGVMDRVVTVHADLGRAEWPGTRELAERQVANYGLRFEVVRRNTGAGKTQDLIEQIEARGMFPDAARRYCTSDQKRAPVLKLMTALVAERYTGRQLKVLNCMGLRAEESKSRALRSPFSRNDAASNGKRDVWEWLPIHDWTETDVWARIKVSGVEHHPAYDAGMPRLSCRFCVLASRSALVLSAQLNPELAQEYVELEERIGHTFKKDLSMAQIVAEAKVTAPIEKVEGWAA